MAYRRSDRDRRQYDDSNSSDDDTDVSGGEEGHQRSCIKQRLELNEYLCDNVNNVVTSLFQAGLLLPSASHV